MAINPRVCKGAPLVLQVDFLSTLLQGGGQDGDTQGKQLNLTSDFSKSSTLRSRIVPC